MVTELIKFMPYNYLYDYMNYGRNHKALDLSYGQKIIPTMAQVT